MRLAFFLRSVLPVTLCICGIVSLAPLPARGQNLFPPGTIIPVQLSNSISSKKAKAGQTFTARVMQDVPLPDRGKIRAGARVVGHVIEVDPAENSSGTRLVLKIDSLVVGHHTIAMRTSLRAIASPLDVEDAQVPAMGADRGTLPDSYVTTQIGGDVVYRGGGHVERHGLVVGEPAPGGVLAPVSSNPSGCRGDVAGNDMLQALWVFSTDACGVYGYNEVEIADAGRNDPEGTIILAVKHGELNIRSGSGLLLRVNPAAHSPFR